MGKNGIERDRCGKAQSVVKSGKSLYYKNKIFAVAPMIDWTETLKNARITALEDGS